MSAAWWLTRSPGAVPGLEDRQLHQSRRSAIGERDPGADDHGLCHPAGLQLLPAVAPGLVTVNLVPAEFAELRLLNSRLQRAIAEREKGQRRPEEAELTLLQSSGKLAALGEMSAAVSHELNQPLAAMKTYLAGARLLLQRRRPDEALSSFQRIDDLIERMGAITRQLKSYARKGGEAFEEVDLRACVSSALAMMEPQLRARAGQISCGMPRQAVLVMADRLRLEQVIINLSA